MHPQLDLENAFAAMGKVLALQLLATLDGRLEVPFAVYSVVFSLNIPLDVAADLVVYTAVKVPERGGQLV